MKEIIQNSTQRIKTNELQNRGQKHIKTILLTFEFQKELDYRREAVFKGIMVENVPVPINTIIRFMKHNVSASKPNEKKPHQDALHRKTVGHQRQTEDQADEET